MDDIYRELIVDRFKNPQYRGTIDPHDFTYEDDNPLCGDVIRIDVILDSEKKVKDARFSGKGCAISLASADLLMEEIRGKHIEKVKELSKEDILEMLGIKLGPVRIKCALLSLKVLKAGVYGVDSVREELDL